MLGNQRHPSQCNALPADGGLDQLVVEPEAQRASRLQARHAIRREPHAPFKPRRATLGIVEMQQHVAREIRRCSERRPAAAHELRAHDRQQALAEEPHGAFGHPRIREIADGDVDVAAAEVDQAVVGRNIDLDVRLARAKRGQSRDHPERGERNRRGDRQARRTDHSARRLGRRSQRAEYRGHVAMELGARRRQRERAVAAHEQRHAERRLERRHLARQRRLGDEHLLRGTGERKKPARRFEALEKVERRQLPQRLMHARRSCLSFRKTVGKHTVTLLECTKSPPKR